MTSRTLLTAVLALSLATPSLAFAAWAPNGNPVCTAPGEQVGPSAASDGAGGMIVAWKDQRRGVIVNGYYDIYANRVLADGTIAPGWPADGVLIKQSGIAYRPRVFPDGNGGALILWREDAALYAQRVTANGTLDPGFPANGKVIASGIQTSTNNFYGFDAVPDGGGGAYVGWSITSGSFGQFWLTRIDANAVMQPGWGPSGVFIDSGGFGSIFFLLAQAPGGDCAAGWIKRQDNGPAADPSTAVIARIHADATREVRTLPTYNLGPFQGPKPGPGGLSVAPDGAGGIFGLKRDTDGFQPPTLTEHHGHHYDAAGTASWPQAAMAPLLGGLISDGGLGVFLLGKTGSPELLQAEYFSSTGAAAWPSGSVIISQPVAFQSETGFDWNFQYAPLMGGAFACWSENAGTGLDIRAALVTPAGTVIPGSGAGGGPICNATGSQINPTVVIDGPGALAAWKDERASTQGDIYANRIVLDLPTAVQVSLAGAEVTAGAVRLRWSVVDPNGTATVLRRTRTSDWTAIGSPELSAGTMSFEDRDVAPDTEYGYALAFSGDPAARLGEHWIQVPALATALTGFVPNPSSGAPRIAFALRTGENARLDVVDLAGRVVHTRDVGAFGPGSHSIGIDGTQLAAGVYVMRLIQGDRVHTARGIIVR